ERQAAGIRRVDPGDLRDLRPGVQRTLDPHRERLRPHDRAGLVQRGRLIDAEVLGVARIDLHAELLAELPHERLERALTGLDLAARLDERLAAALPHDEPSPI